MYGNFTYRLAQKLLRFPSNTPAFRANVLRRNLAMVSSLHHFSLTTTYETFTDHAPHFSLSTSRSASGHTRDKCTDTLVVIRKGTRKAAAVARQSLSQRTQQMECVALLL
jgi:hypothetical protein